MKARALGEVLSLPPADRVPVLTEGLNLLAEHVETLRTTVADLIKRADPRGAAILDAVAVEETGKILTLLDFARAGTKNQPRLTRTVRHFYDHVARGIYAEVSMMRPANYGETKDIVEFLRPSFYRDGPEGFEWVFRNRIESQREERIYVDFVHDDNGNRWVSPERGDSSLLWSPSPATDVAVALHRSGLFTTQGVRAIAIAWHDAPIDDDLQWQDVRQRNIEALDTAGEAGLQSAELTQHALSTAVEQWSFPLFDLDLRKRKVEQAQLDEQYRQGEAQFYRNL